MRQRSRLAPSTCIIPWALLTSSQGVYIATATYPISSTFIKLALLMQYLRVLDGRATRILCKIMIILTIMAGVGFGVVTWFACIPTAAFWEMGLKATATCWGFGSVKWANFRPALLSQVITTALMDLIVFLIPVRLYFQPGTPRATRLSLLGLFFLGISYVTSSSAFTLQACG